MIDKFKSFTDGLKISDETSDKLKRTFKGVFSAVDLLKKGFSSIISPAIPRNVSKIPSDSFDKNSLTFPLSLRDVKKSPTDAVMFSNPSMIPFSPPEPRNFPIGLIDRKRKADRIFQEYFQNFG